MPLPANLAATTSADLQRLIDDEEAEGPHLEFKRELPKGDQGGRHELAADVSALANSGGGDVIFGMDEAADGLAGAIVPCPGDADQEARRLLDMLGSLVEPRLPGLQVHPVAVDGGFVVVVRVPQSWAGPHRVKTNQHFFIREGGRKRQLDIPEIRGLFLRTESQSQKVRDFRTDRLGAILAGRAPVLLMPGATQVLHLIPTQAALGLMSVDPIPYTQRQTLPVFETAGKRAGLNIDGAIAAHRNSGQGTDAYSQFFRNGFFEAVKVDEWDADGATSLSGTSFEDAVIQLVTAFREELSRTGHPSEMTVMWSLQGADRTKLTQTRDFRKITGRFDRPTIVLPDVLLLAEEPVERALRPLFDLMWQAAGQTGSLSYDSLGHWNPKG